jgi:hypothetical protein
MEGARLTHAPAVEMGLRNYTAERPLLLWTDFPPDHGGGGAVILRSLISEDDRSKVLWVSPALTGVRATDRMLPLVESSLVRTGRRSVFLDSTFLAPALARETLHLAEVHGARALWLVLHGAGVPVAAELIKRGRLPVHVTVHDDPAFAVAMRSRRYLALTPWIERQFGASIRGATSVDVIGEGMQERYLRRYGVRSTIVHRAIVEPVSPASRYDQAVAGLRVGLLGNLYSYSQLPVLGRALARAARTLGVRACMTFVGNGFGERLKKDLAGLEVDVENTGHVDEARAVAILRACYALYLNYPFAARDAVLRETSFPTKLGTYALAARPIVAHAPVGTTLAPLESLTGYVHPWKTMSETDGEDLFVRMWRNEDLRASSHEPAERLRLKYFDPRRNGSALATILDSLVPSFDGRPLWQPRDDRAAHNAIGARHD